jgi:hypothetical protein
LKEGNQQEAIFKYFSLEIVNEMRNRNWMNVITHQNRPIRACFKFVWKN